MTSGQQAEHSGANDLLLELADSMEKVEYHALSLQAEDLPPLGGELLDALGAWGCILGCLFFLLGLRQWLLRRQLQRRWPGMFGFVMTSQGVAEALYEFQRAELLSSVLSGSLNTDSGGWLALSDSEQAIALGTLMDKSTRELADELACTPSYIYNVRASIRKKWDLDPEVNLRSAIAERYAKTGKPFPKAE